MIIEIQFRISQRFFSSKLVLKKTVESRFAALNHYENSSSVRAIYQAILYTFFTHTLTHKPTPINTDVGISTHVTTQVRSPPRAHLHI